MSEQSDPKLGINSWLEEELYQTYLHDRKYVDESWKTVFETNGHPQPAPAQIRNGASSRPTLKSSAPPVAVGPTEESTPLRGVASKIAENMAISLTIPTATSQRVVQVRVMDENRRIINQHRTMVGKSKVSYTHLIGWAIFARSTNFARLNDAYAEQDGQPFRVVRKQINLGVAVDVEGKDGARH